MIAEFAPAKVNLALHITGRRADGYHLLSSLVGFVAVGDRITVRASDRLTLSISGPFAEGLSTDRSNLVMRAAEAFGQGQGAEIHLEKNLPTGAGIGGGSADAAASLRALSKLWGQPIPEALPLGADVPVCVRSTPMIMEGIGELLRPVAALPKFHIVLINPGASLSTPEVFSRRQGRFSMPLPPVPGPEAARAAWVDWLRTTGNDLTAPALTLLPDLQDVLDTLADQQGALMARMSGSGATCFALFDGPDLAARAAARLRTTFPKAWVKASVLRA